MRALRERKAPIITVSLLLVVLCFFIFYFGPLVTSLIPGILIVVPLIVTAIWIRFLTSAEREDFNWQVSKWIGVLAVFIGALFWLSSDTSYVTSIRMLAPYTAECCFGQPTLPVGVALIPWLMISTGTLTLFLAFSRRRLTPVFEVASFGLFASVMLTGFISFGGPGWPLPWLASSLYDFEQYTGRIFGTAILAPFLLDWVFWTALTCLLMCLGGLLFIHSPLLETTTSVKLQDSRLLPNPKDP